MNAPAPPLPEFRRPPVSEVVLSIQFDPLAQLDNAQLGLIWQRFRERFPRTETHPPLPSTVERFGVRRPFKLGVEVELSGQPPVPRLWLLNEAGTELIQVQQDRFIRNWRKRGDDDPYPRYPYLRTTFISDLDEFQQHLRNEQLGELAPVQAEITYVDEIVAGAGWERHGQLDEILTVWARRHSGRFPSEPESAQLNIRYVIPDDAGEPLGRLHVDIQPAFRADGGAPILLMTMTARGRPDGEGIDGVFRFFDRGHEWLVRTFASITTEKMHRIWERSDESSLA